MRGARGAALAAGRTAVGAVLAAGLLAALAVPVPAVADERLSDERTVTRWAHVEGLAAIRRAPAADAPVAGRLRWLTEDGYPEVYLALRARADGAGRSWIEVRIPGRPNGRRGWVPREALGPLHTVRTHLLVDRRTLRATLRRAGRVVWSSPVGVGARGTPTPPGRFYVRERLRVIARGSVYGPWAFGTSAYSALSDWPGGGVVGIHGTNRPRLIPGRPSHGCIRVPNPAIRRLARLLPVGTPVWIR